MNAVEDKFWDLLYYYKKSNTCLRSQAHEFIFMDLLIGVDKCVVLVTAKPNEWEQCAEIVDAKVAKCFLQCKIFLIANFLMQNCKIFHIAKLHNISYCKTAKYFLLKKVQNVLYW